MLIGLFLIPKLTLQLYPSQISSSITVECEMEGATSEVVEIELSSVLERVITRLNGISKISSISSDGFCRIEVKLDKWTDPEVFRFETSVLLRQISSQLPKKASYPRVSVNVINSNSQNGSLMEFALSGPGDIKEIAEKIVRPAFSDIIGIEQINITGYQSDQYKIKIDNEAINAVDMSYFDIQQLLKDGLKTEYLGTYSNLTDHFSMFMDRQIKKIDHLGMYPVLTSSGRIVRLNELSHVEKGSTVQTSFYRINGQEVVTISFVGDKKINAIELAKRINDRLERITTLFPSHVKLALIYDSTESLTKEIDKIYIRTGLSISILIVFIVFITRRLYYILIIVSTLLANLLLASIFYYLIDVEIHLYSLAGITLSLGLVIDNSIVVVEDIINTGRKRIFVAIFASTLLAIAALSAIFLLEEEQQLLLRDFALTIIINLLVSLPIAFFLIPALLALFPIKNRSKRQHSFKSMRRIAKWSIAYQKQLKYMIKYRLLIILSCLWVFGLPFFLLPERINNERLFSNFYNKTFGSEFYNSTLRENINQILGGSLYLFINSNEAFFQKKDLNQETKLYVNISTPKGATIEQIDQNVRNFERFLSNYQDKLKRIESFVFALNRAKIIVYFKDNTEINFPYIIKDYLERLASTEGGADFHIFGVGQGFNNAINVNRFDSSISIKGYNYKKLRELADVLKDSLQLNQRVKDILISSVDQNEILPVPELYSRLNGSRQLGFYGISKLDISKAIEEISSSDEIVGQIPLENNKIIDVRLQNYSDKPPILWDLLNSPMKLNDSVTLKIAGISNLEWIRRSENIVRKNQEYILNVHYKFMGNYELNNMLQKKIVTNYSKQLPFGYSIVLNQYEGKWSDGSNRYLWLIPLVLLVVYILGAALFESLTKPFAVIMIIPFSFIGVFLIFRLLGLGMNEGAYASMLLVSSLVTNTALYIINDFNFFYKKGRTTLQTYNRAFQAKATPIIITNLSAILSLLPFMINGDDQGFWFTLSAGTIGGLLFSIIAAYILLPLCLIKRNESIKLKKYV